MTQPLMLHPSRVALVTGARNWTDAELIRAALDDFRPTLLIVGDARGADAIARQWANEHHIACRVFKADWRSNGKGAGPIRNARMTENAVALQEMGATVHCFAFPLPESRGTLDCIRQAEKRGIAVYYR